MRTARAPELSLYPYKPISVAVWRGNPENSE